MKAELKREWVNTLLDDDTAQCRSIMRAFDGSGNVAYCPWGVLLDIAHTNGVVELGREDVSDLGHSRFVYNGQSMAVYPSYELMADLGIPWNCGPSADIRQYIAGHNDNGSNFIFIAGEIEEYVPVD